MWLPTHAPRATIMSADNWIPPPSVARLCSHGGRPQWPSPAARGAGAGAEPCGRCRPGLPYSPRPAAAAAAAGRCWRWRRRTGRRRQRRAAWGRRRWRSRRVVVVLRAKRRGRGQGAQVDEAGGAVVLPCMHRALLIWRCRVCRQGGSMSLVATLVHVARRGTVEAHDGMCTPRHANNNNKLEGGADRGAAWLAALQQEKVRCCSCCCTCCCMAGPVCPYGRKAKV